MLALSAIATLLAMAIAGAAIFGVLERFVAQGLDRRLDAELSLVATAVRADGKVDRLRLAQIAPALEADRGWRWRIVAPRESVSSPDFPILTSPPDGPERFDGPHRNEERARPVGGRDPEGRDVRARMLTLASRDGPVVVTAAAPWRIVSRPVRGAIVPLLLTLASLGLALAAASIVQLRVGLRPLRRLRDEVAAVRQGRSQEVDENQPDELRPLATELNSLLHDNAAALRIARASAANLAHALKTPVATLALELRDQPSKAAQVDRMYATIRHHLARARSGLIDRHASTPLEPAIPDLVATVARLYAGQSIAFSCSVPNGVSVAIDPADLDEVVGNLIENAARHARSRVAISCEVQGRIARLSVANDGPGLSAEDRRRATLAGVRLDERAESDGFGLAIARELAELHGGSLILNETRGGGLLACVQLAVVC